MPLYTTYGNGVATDFPVPGAGTVLSVLVNGSGTSFTQPDGRHMLRLASPPPAGQTVVIDYALTVPRFRLEEFGGGTSATAAQNSAAFSAIFTATGGVCEIALGPGDYQVNAINLTTTAAVRLAITGSGMGITRLIQQDNTRVLLVNLNDPGIDPTPGSWVVLNAFTMVGTWQANQSLGGDSNRHVDIRRVAQVALSRVESQYCRMMALTALYCGDVSVNECRVLYCARDAINLASCYRTSVLGNHIRHCNDDAIAVHVTGAQFNPPPEGHVISGNYCEDSFGIKMLGARNSTVSNNVCRRVKGYGIYLNHEDPEGRSDHINVNISDNTILDVFQAACWPGFGNVQHGIFVGNRATSATLRVIGGTPTIARPEVTQYASNQAASKSVGARGIRITGNIIAQTLAKPTNNYTEFGFNRSAPALQRSFASGGWTDLTSTWASFTTINSGNAIVLTGFIDSVDILNNNIEGWSRGILPSASAGVFEVNVRGNRFFRIAQYAVDLESGAVRRGMFLLEGNFFDLDPYLENSQHNANGTWTLTTTQFGSVANTFNWDGPFFFVGNTFRNCHQIIRGGGNGRVVYAGNTYIMQPGSGFTHNNGGFNGATNRGIGFPNGALDPTARILWEDSDPTSATYGQVTHASGRAVAGSPGGSTVLAGITGDLWLNTDSTLGGIVGYRRLTTGTGNAIGTDWAIVGTRHGTSTQNGTGAQTVFTIPHGLGTTPAGAQVNAGSADARGPFHVSWDATNITVTYGAAPASGTNNVVLRWTVHGS
jgi:hypothetical protein